MLTDPHPDGIRADDVPHSVAQDYGVTSGMTEAGVAELMPKLQLEVARAVNAWRRHRPDAETLSTHVGWDNSEPPQLWRWSGSLAEADESAEPLERLEHASDVVKAPDPDAETPPAVALTETDARILRDAKLVAYAMSRINLAEKIDALLARSADPSAWCVVRRNTLLVAQGSCRVCAKLESLGPSARERSSQADEDIAAALAGEAPAAEGDE